MTDPNTLYNLTKEGLENLDLDANGRVESSEVGKVIASSLNCEDAAASMPYAQAIASELTQILTSDRHLIMTTLSQGVEVVEPQDVRSGLTERLSAPDCKSR